jgi:hypothetical protein
MRISDHYFRMRDTKTILLVLLSVGIIATWVYHLYDKTQYSKQATELKIIKAPTIKDLQDSLQTVYIATVDQLGAQLDSVKSTAGLLQGELISKLDEINRLKTEIADLLRMSNAKRSDIDLVGQKTTKLQQLVANLPVRNTIEPLRTTQTVVSTTSSISKNETATNEAADPQSVFLASEVRMTPLHVTDDTESETDQADNTNKLLISFSVKNSTNDLSNAEVFAVITQPDGKVLQTDQWESATINTHDYGKKTYTRRMRFQYQKGELKQLQLTIKPEDYEKGNYRLQVFHNGYLIGETNRRLN